MKKIISLLLTILMLIGAVMPVSSVYAADSSVFRATETYIGHTSVTENASNRYVEQQYDSNGADPNGEGKFARLFATDAGCTLSFAVTVEKNAVYDMVIRFRAHESTGISEIALNGVAIGSLDSRSGVNGHTANQCYNAEYASIPFVAGENVITFTTTGRGVSGYGINIFTFTLSEVDTTVMTGSQTPNSVSYLTVGQNGYSEFNGTMVADSDHPDGSWAANYAYQDMYCFRVTDGSYFGYQIDVAEAGSYTLQWIARGHNGSYGTFGVYLNGTKAENLVKSGVSTQYHETKMLTLDLGTVELVKGNNTVYFVSEEDASIEHNVFVSGAIVISDNSTVITPDHVTAGYVTTRSNEKDAMLNDLRVVLVSDLSVLAASDAVTVTLDFSLDGTTVVSHTRKVGESGGFMLYRSVWAAGKRYITEEGYAIYGLVITEIPPNAWDTLTVSVTADGALISAGTVSASTLFE